MTNPERLPCECSDPGCPACQGHCERPYTTILYRVDMEDETGTAMCEECAADAMDCGLFRELLDEGGDE